MLLQILVFIINCRSLSYPIFKSVFGEILPHKRRRQKILCLSFIKQTKTNQYWLEFSLLIIVFKIGYRYNVIIEKERLIFKKYKGVKRISMLDPKI